MIPKDNLDDPNPRSPDDDSKEVPTISVEDQPNNHHKSLPQSIGPYRILSQLGEGGMGTVYLAEQRSPIHRRVALKVVKLGMDTKQTLARFEIEREALAMMNHPGIAKVFDAGISEAGRSYFVMEYVPGISITEYCDNHRISTRERLRLFIHVCKAIQHAHQKGIIHRDLKPSNVLVAEQDHVAVPKVIDFGVAKATQQRLTEQTLFTEHGQLLGTPGYMSPEQAETTSLDIDTRSDIYSLGALLYELLIGTRPFEDKVLLQGGFAEIQRVIREVDPPKPSTRLSSLGESAALVVQKRRTDLRILGRVLRGDLDWVVMKCLEKNRNRRYDTANDLAEEIERYLNNEPVIAGPPSTAYRVKKFVKRNRTFVGVASVACILIASAFLSISQLYVAALNAERHAIRESARVREALAESTAYSAVLENVLRLLHLQESTTAQGGKPQQGFSTANRLAVERFREYITTVSSSPPQSDTPISTARKVCGPNDCSHDSRNQWYSFTACGAGTVGKMNFDAEAPIMIALIDGIRKLSENAAKWSLNCVLQGDFAIRRLDEEESVEGGFFLVSKGRLGRCRIHAFDSVNGYVVSRAITALLIPHEKKFVYAVTGDFADLVAVEIDIRMITRELAIAGVDVTEIRETADGIVEVCLRDNFFSVQCVPGEASGDDKRGEN